MTIPAAVPAEQAERLQDERHMKHERIYDTHKEHAREKVADRFWKQEGDQLMTDALVEMTFGDAIRTEKARHLLRTGHDLTELGRIWYEAVEKYVDSYLDDHEDEVREECMELETDG